jgi:hypothetical protein
MDCKAIAHCIPVQSPIPQISLLQKNWLSEFTDTVGLTTV